MAEIDRSGPAFPRSKDCIDKGMSLRDWFAGQAVAGLAAKHGIEMGPNTTAITAYAYADALLEARKRG